jgi:hypothetical protein
VGSTVAFPIETCTDIEAPVGASAALSLVFWLGILCAGRAIGYVAGRSGMHYK